MTPHEIRELVDRWHSRVTDAGEINAAHAAMESTLRDQHGHPSFIAELDGPGKFRPVDTDAANIDTNTKE